MNISNREIFARNLLRLMDERGLKQVDIANALKVSKTAVSEWTRALKYPRIDTMQRLADYLDVPMQILTLEHDQEDERSEVFLSLYDRLSPDQQKMICQAMKGMLEDR